MADNLESYFKKHLSGDKPAEDKWNVPSDDVWDKVTPVIQRKRGLFIPWKYLYIIGILLLIGLGIIFWRAGSEDFFENDLISVTEQNNEPDQSSRFSNENIEVTSNKSLPSSSITSEEQDEDSDLPSEGNLPEVLQTEIDKQITQNTSPTGLNESAKNIEPNSNNIADQAGFNNRMNNKSSRQKGNIPSTVSSYDYKITNNEVIITQNENTNRNSGKIGSLAQASIRDLTNYDFRPVLKEQHNTNTNNPETEEQKVNLKPYNNKGKVGAGAYFMPTFTTTYLTGDLNSGHLETSNMYLYSSNWRLEIRYFLSNRFTLVTGIGWSDVRSWSTSFVDFDYDTSGEHNMGTGEKENTSAVPMPTPFGEIGTEITYRFPGEQDIPDGEAMQSELETHQEVRYLSIPLGVEFNIIRFSRFNWFTETGFRYNRAIKDAASFSSSILHEGDEMEVVGEEMTGHPTFTEHYVDIYLGTGIGYQLSKSFLVSGSARYFNSITKVNEQDNMSTHVRGFNVNIGLVYIF